MMNNIELNDDLVATAMKMSNTKTKKEVIQKTLKEYVKTSNLHRRNSVPYCIYLSFTP